MKEGAERLVDVAQPRISIPIREGCRIESSEYLEVGTVHHRKIAVSGIASFFSFVSDSRSNAKIRQ